MKRSLPLLGATALALAVGGSAAPAQQYLPSASAGPGGYPWPVAPFGEAHPIRAVVGDPRTIFRNELSDPLAGAGTFSFHDGVDIDAPNGTPVYPVLSGFARWVVDDGVLVQADDGRLFMYRHIVPAVGEGATVTAQETILGRVENWAHELHFSEFTPDEKIVNPLGPGHLSPYRDTTTPTVAGLEFRNGRGSRLAPFNLHDRVAVVADAYDEPMPPEGKPTRRLSKFARDGFPVAPAVLTWSLSVLGGRVIFPPTTVVDFRPSVARPNGVFWSVYARGTYQNRSVIGVRMHGLMPGRYLFRLTRSDLDTRRLANGVYVVTVTAIDVAGNRGSRSERIEIWNARNAR